MIFTFWVLIATSFVTVAILLVFVGWIWLVGPRWIVSRIPEQSDLGLLEAQDQFRKTLTPVLGIPLVTIGAVGILVTAIQGVDTFRKSQELAYKESYKSGFEALASENIGTRIGGLYTLGSLIDPSDPQSCPEKTADDKRANVNIVTALAAYALSTADAVFKDDSKAPTPADAIVALRIAARHQVQGAQGIDLRNAKFSGMSAPCAKLNDANLSNAHLTGADLFSASLHEANLRFAFLEGANLAGADLSNAGLSGTHFIPGINEAVGAMNHGAPVSVQMAGAHLQHTFGNATNFSQACLWGVDFSGAVLTSADFTGAWLGLARFSGATLTTPIFHDTNLQEAVFSPPDGQSESPVIDTADFHGASLEKTDLRRSRLKAANFQNADLRDARFDNAELENPDFRGADLTGAHFENAKIIHPNLENALLDDTALNSGSFDPKDLSTASICHANSSVVGSGNTACKQLDRKVDNKPPTTDICKP